MAQNVTLYNLLISCPGDIKEEVTLIESAVDEFNELYAEKKKKLKLCFNLENKCLCIFRISLSHHQK